MRKLTTAASAVALIASTIATPAFADTIPTPPAAGPDAAALSVMEAQCDALAALHGAAWSGDVDLGSITASAAPLSGPTEVPGSRIIDESSIEGTGVYTPSGLSIAGDPFRNGGSVNMFGNQWATAATYSDSTYFYDADFETTYAYSFTCDMSESVFVPVAGYYVIEPTDQGNEEAGQNSCNAFTALGSTWEHWGNDHAQCDFVTTTPEHYEDQERADEAGTPENSTQTDNLNAFEDHGGPITIGGNIFVGQVVVCISPSSTTKKGVPGEWRQQNGYTGDKCNTTYFNSAPWGGGSQTSNGTYISVPPVV